MAEPFKNLVNRDVIRSMANHFEANSSEFDKICFIADATQGLEFLELKERTNHVTDIMIKYFPDDFEEAGKIILASLGSPLGDLITSADADSDGISGWAIMPLVHYVALQGHDYFDLSMQLFKELTKRASSEFGIRYFLLKYPKKTMAILRDWALDRDHHVRRLASEGSRPRLPWAMQLPMFIEDPAPVIKLLEILKDDESEYVRRSVANSLNDIAKDHPELVADIAEKWLLKASNKRVKLVRHACRTLIKNGHKKTLAVLGYKSPSIHKAQIEVLTPKVIFGEALEFSLLIESASNKTQDLMIDYAIHHQKANGKTSPKVFKLRTAKLLNNKTLIITKKHPIKKITTRVYYAGLHSVEVMVNGVSIGKADFQLVI